MTTYSHCGSIKKKLRITVWCILIWFGTICWICIWFSSAYSLALYISLPCLLLWSSARNQLALITSIDIRTFKRTQWSANICALLTADSLVILSSTGWTEPLTGSFLTLSFRNYLNVIYSLFYLFKRSSALQFQFSRICWFYCATTSFLGSRSDFESGGSNLGFTIIAGMFSYFWRFLTQLYFKENNNFEPLGLQTIHANKPNSFTIPSLHTNELVWYVQFYFCQVW